MDIRNPYVILGIPFGSSREDANVAFARRAKRLRHAGGDIKRQMTDLTWALNMIDEAISHPEAAMEIYRIPADPSAFEVDGTGTFTPSAETLAPRPGDAAAAFAMLQARAAHSVLRELLRVRAAQIPVPLP